MSPSMLRGIETERHRTDFHLGRSNLKTPVFLERFAPGCRGRVFTRRPGTSTGLLIAALPDQHIEIAGDHRDRDQIARSCCHGRQRRSYPPRRWGFRNIPRESRPATPLRARRLPDVVDRVVGPAADKDPGPDLPRGSVRAGGLGSPIRRRLITDEGVLRQRCDAHMLTQLAELWAATPTRLSEERLILFSAPRTIR